MAGLHSSFDLPCGLAAFNPFRSEADPWMLNSKQRFPSARMDGPGALPVWRPGVDRFPTPVSVVSQIAEVAFRDKGSCVPPRSITIDGERLWKSSQEGIL